MGIVLSRFSFPLLFDCRSSSVPTALIFFSGASHGDFSFLPRGLMALLGQAYKKSLMLARPYPRTEPACLA
jgi:hypothetical protein